MNLSDGSLSILYLNPLLSLASGWQWKLWASAAGVFALETLAALFAVRLDLVSLVAVLVVVDLLTGIAASRRRRDRVTSRGLRRTIVKTIEYTAFLASVVAVSNVLGVAGTIPVVSALLANLAEVSFAYVALTELNSIYENLSPDGRASRAFRAVWVWLRRRDEDGVFEGVMLPIEGSRTRELEREPGDDDPSRTRNPAGDRDQA